jgi:hypothetical protein
VRRGAKELARAERRRDELQAGLTEAGTDHALLAERGRELAAAQAEVERLEERWLQLGTELEERSSPGSGPR